MSDDYADDERYAMASEFFPLDGKPTSVFMSSANADALGRVVLAARAVDALYHPEAREGEHWCYTDTMPGPQARFTELRAALADLDKLSKT